MTERKNRKILMIFEDKELSILFTYSMLMIIFCYFGDFSIFAQVPTIFPDRGRSM